MLPVALRAIDRCNAAHPWSHNDLYHRWVLRTLPRRMGRTLDIGCGTGNLVRALSRRAEVAEGLDADAAVIATARELSPHHPAARFTVGDLLDAPGTGRYDAVTAIAVVHHVPLRDALLAMRTLLAPGGTIVVLGCYRARTRTDHLLDVVAIPANLVVGLALSSRARAARVAMSAPTSPPTTTLAEVRAVAEEVLPGARIRRRLFWRYSLVHRAT